MSTRSGRSSLLGVTLVELVVFIVIVGVALAGLFSAFNTMTAASADPLVRKQVLAIAESLMDEIALLPFTLCDPDDPAATTATVVGDCATQEGIGTEGAETRHGTTLRFDNVSDFDGFTMGPGIQDITNTTVGGLGAYSVTNVTVTAAGLGTIPAAEALRISITVAGPGGVTVTLEGYRTRYAPNTLP